MGVSTQQPSIGRIVHYRLSDEDISKAPNTVFARGNRPYIGGVYPAVIVRTADDDLRVNLRVLLDGPDDLWVTSAGYSVDTDGCWFWPPRVGG